MPLVCWLVWVSEWMSQAKTKYLKSVSGWQQTLSSPKYKEKELTSRQVPLLHSLPSVTVSIHPSFLGLDLQTSPFLLFPFILSFRWQHSLSSLSALSFFSIEILCYKQILKFKPLFIPLFLMSVQTRTSAVNFNASMHHWNYLMLIGMMKKLYYPRVF